VSSAQPPPPLSSLPKNRKGMTNKPFGDHTLQMSVTYRPPAALLRLSMFIRFEKVRERFNNKKSLQPKPSSTFSHLINVDRRFENVLPPLAWCWIV
jgi:hypothetical protein